MAKRDIDFDGIRREWEAGQLSIREIARQFGVSDGLIRKRAQSENWGERPQAVDVIRKPVRSTHTREPSAHERHIVALTAFERAIGLLHRHRAFLFRLHGDWAVLIEDLAAVRKKKLDSGRTFTLKEIEMQADILAKASAAMARLIPLERRAFGFTDNDGPSEFDGMTEEEFSAIMETFQRAIGP
jgi:transposase-like protein